MLWLNMCNDRAVLATTKEKLPDSAFEEGVDVASIGDAVAGDSEKVVAENLVVKCLGDECGFANRSGTGDENLSRMNTKRVKVRLRLAREVTVGLRVKLWNCGRLENRNSSIFYPNALEATADTGIAACVARTRAARASIS